VTEEPEPAKTPATTSTVAAVVGIESAPTHAADKQSRTPNGLAYPNTTKISMGMSFLQPFELHTSWYIV
jgi:hypothetical protein